MPDRQVVPQLEQVLAPPDERQLAQVPAPLCVAPQAVQPPVAMVVVAVAEAPSTSSKAQEDCDVSMRPIGFERL